ncbi:hypothetical protein IQ06DRAFT_78301 [Phaeosphaeriaceae sp. SRC1lsM3a]|nr:hypothetical protein IQ06DRAFT_78301 [Stagonospora sp. SRC1lsM3a]
MVATRSQLRAAGSTTQHAPAEPVTIPYLPPEILRIIAQYINTEDLPAYRLVSKLCASIGAEELFSSIAFHCSSASVARIDAIKACEHLNKVVTSLVWDANFWSIPNVRDLHEWRGYFKAKAFATSKPMEVGDNFGTDEVVQLAHCRHAWVDYLSRVKDEKAVKRGSNMQKVLQGFQNLHKLHILNGGFKRRHRAIGKSSDWVDLPAPPASHYRGESLYNDGPTVARLQRPGAYPFHILQNFSDNGPHLTKLRLDAVCCSAFSGQIDRSPLLETLLSFHIRLTIRFEHHWPDSPLHDRPFHSQSITNHVHDATQALNNRNFTAFLRRLTKLESLKIEFDGPVYNEDGRLQSPFNVRDIAYDNYTWPHLRKLKLRQLDTTSAALLSLLEAQRSTLRVLKLYNIWFLPESYVTRLDHTAIKPAPSDVLRRLAETLRLDQAGLSGLFGPGPTLPGEWWDFTDPCLSNAVEDYLLNGGSLPKNTTYG